LTAKGFVTPTPIQAQAIPPMLEGRDLLGIAQTGTGKTGAFVLPILNEFLAHPERPTRCQTRSLILAPTRELALQIDESVRALAAGTPLKTLAIYGGVGKQPQINRMRRGVDIVVGTPGRVLDLIRDGHLNLGKTSHFVLDEADQMLDLGFIKDVRAIVSGLPHRRKSYLFSATMPQSVRNLADSLLTDPVEVSVTPAEPTPDRIEQKVFMVPSSDKRTFLSNLLEDQSITRAIVFTRTKHLANRVAEHLEKGGVQAEAIHGNKSQGARQKSLERFRKGDARVLVATDIAARGIDVKNISHVINFDLPNVPESYVHRIGRTARAGQEGLAFSFCDRSEIPFLRGIERLTGIKIPVEGELPPAPFGGRSKPHGRAGGRPGGRGNGRPAGRSEGRSDVNADGQRRNGHRDTENRSKNTDESRENVGQRSHRSQAGARHSDSRRDTRADGHQGKGNRRHESRPDVSRADVSRADTGGQKRPKSGGTSDRGRDRDRVVERSNDRTHDRPHDRKRAKKPHHRGKGPKSGFQGGAAASSGSGSEPRTRPTSKSA